MGGRWWIITGIMVFALLPVPLLADALSANATVANSLPAISVASITPDDSGDAGYQIYLGSHGGTSVVLNASGNVSDANGYQDMNQTSSYCLWGSANSTVSFSNCSNTTCELSCNATFTSSNAAQNYELVVNISDTASSSASATAFYFYNPSPTSSSSTSSSSGGVSGGGGRSSYFGVMRAGGTTLSLEGQEIGVSRELAAGEGERSTVSLVFRNNGAETLRNIELREHIPIDDQGEVEFSVQPTRIERGSIVAVWLIGELAPQAELDMSYAIKRKMSGLEGFYASVARAPVSAGEGIVTPPKEKILPVAEMTFPYYVEVGEFVKAGLSIGGELLGAAKVSVRMPSGKVLALMTDDEGRLGFYATEEGTYEYAVEGYAIAGDARMYAMPTKAAKPIEREGKKELRIIQVEVTAPGTGEEVQAGVGNLARLAGYAVILIAILATFVFVIVMLLYEKKGKKQRGASEKSGEKGGAA